ncbi:MAG TPA: isoprenylcysteine carboxylmethyltransferase family protein [Gemmatimonadales bacterium]|nr:isoprenylcysteine carboxylmethyltransferase family protein [Gemmatimonadales bacterium]
MNHDPAFRAVLIVVFLIVLPIGVYHRVESHSTREKLDRRQEGLFILATLRPVGAAFWLGVLAWMVNPGWMTWSSMPVPVWLRWTGVAVMAAGSGLLAWTFRSLGRNLTDTVVTRQEHTLVVDGPYRWVRHPLYVSAALLTVAISLVAANWFLLVTGIVVLFLLIMRTRIEERNLAARFGNRYRTYMRRTGAFVPRFGADRRRD